MTTTPLSYYVAVLPFGESEGPCHLKTRPTSLRPHQRGSLDFPKERAQLAAAAACVQLARLPHALFTGSHNLDHHMLLLLQLVKSKQTIYFMATHKFILLIITKSAFAWQNDLQMYVS